MQADYSVNLKWAFVLGEEGLKKLSRLLSERIGSVEYSAHCVDDVVRRFTTFTELMSYENAKSRHITRLSISARSDDYSKRATIDMSGFEWRGISIDIHARDDVVDRLRGEILDILSGMRPWYGSFPRVDSLLVPFFAFIALYLGLLATIAFRPSVAKLKPSDSEAALGALIIIGGLALLFALGFLSNRFRDRFFPTAVFLIGQGGARFQHLERRRNFWLVTIVIAFIVNLAAGLLVAFVL